MAPIIKILRGHTAPPVLEAGRIAIDQTNKNLYVGIDDGNGGTINEIVGGSGTFATKQFVTDAVSSGTGSLGTMSTQNADSVAITGGAIDGTAIGATTPSTGKFTTIEDDNTTPGINIFKNPTQFAYGIEGFNGSPLYITNTIDLSIGTGRLEGLTVDPILDTDAARKKYVDDKVSALGGVFHFVSDIIWGAPTPYDLDTMAPDLTTGAYYRVGNDATFTSGGNSFAAKTGDAIVKTSTGWQKLDNVDVEVLGTADEISVSGDENAGYTVAIDPVFSGRISDVESKTQNIDIATSAGTTKINGTLEFVEANGTANMVGTVIADGSSAINSYASGGDNYFKVDYDEGIILGPQYNTWATKVRNKLEGVENNGSLPTIENFVIDGGEY